MCRSLQNLIPRLSCYPVALDPAACWFRRCRSLRNESSWWIGAFTGLAYTYMVMVWGGYIFVLNMIGMHAGLLWITGWPPSRLSPFSFSHAHAHTYSRIRISRPAGLVTRSLLIDYFSRLSVSRAVHCRCMSLGVRARLSSQCRAVAIESGVRSDLA